MRNPLAEPALFGAPQAAAAAAALVIAFGFASVTSFAVPVAGILGATVSIAGLVAIAGRRASLTVTLLAGLALASFAGAVTALILNLAPNPFIALEIAFWLLGSLEDRSSDHLDHRGAVHDRELDRAGGAMRGRSARSRSARTRRPRSASMSAARA